MFNILNCLKENREQGFFHKENKLSVLITLVLITILSIMITVSVVDFYNGKTITAKGKEATLISQEEITKIVETNNCFLKINEGDKQRISAPNSMISLKDIKMIEIKANVSSSYKNYLQIGFGSVIKNKLRKEIHMDKFIVTSTLNKQEDLEAIRNYLVEQIAVCK